MSGNLIIFNNRDAGPNYGFSVNQRNPKTGLTPLMYAASTGNLETLRWLIENGANVRESYSWINWSTALVFAANNNQVACVKELLRYEEDHANDLWSAVDAALMQAPAYSDSFYVLREYIDAHPSRLERCCHRIFG